MMSRARPPVEKHWTLAGAVLRSSMAAEVDRSPDIRTPNVGADGTDLRFALDKGVETKIIVYESKSYQTQEYE